MKKFSKKKIIDGWVPGVVASWVEPIIRKRAELLLLLRQRPEDFGLPCGQHDLQILIQ
jgi:hypothetical protein